MKSGWIAGLLFVAATACAGRVMAGLAPLQLTGRPDGLWHQFMPLQARLIS